MKVAALALAVLAGVLMLSGSPWAWYALFAAATTYGGHLTDRYLHTHYPARDAPGTEPHRPAGQKEGTP